MHTKSLFYAFLCLSERFMLISQRPIMGHFMLISSRTPFLIVGPKTPPLMLIRLAIGLMLVGVWKKVYPTVGPIFNYGHHSIHLRLVVIAIFSLFSR